ncbi:hypothetical protein EDD11_004352 [Mortierella claussenii]|nr:hypothetical protein EDD11_004352 [Mortierella claussenii]
MSVELQQIIEERNPYLYESVQRTHQNLKEVEEYHAAHSVPTAPGYEPSSFNHKYISLRGHKYHYVEEGNPDGLPLVLVHGFPDLWYGWRYQIRHLAKEGYRVIAIDNLGTGETDQPQCDFTAKYENLEPYTAKNITSNLIDLLDQLNIEKAVFIGHDWGGSIVWKVGLHFPERCHAIVSICIPFAQPSGRAVQMEEILPYFPHFKYYVAYKDGKQETEWFDGDAHTQAVAFFNTLYGTRPGTNVEEKQYYIDQFSRSTFHGSLNFYRVDFLNLKDELQYVGKTYKAPVLQLNVEGDTILVPQMMALYNNDWIEDFEKIHVYEGGHNVMTENPDGINKILSEFLAKRAFHKTQPQKEQTLQAQEV